MIFTYKSLVLKIIVAFTTLFGVFSTTSARCNRVC